MGSCELLLIVACCAATLPARTADQTETINLSLMLILAEKTGGNVEVDEQLKPIANALKKAYPEYQRFTLQAGDTQTVDTGESVDVEDDQTESKAKATYKRRSKSRYLIAVKTWRKEKLVHGPTIKSKLGQVSFLTTFLDKDRKEALITSVLPAKSD